MASKKKNRKAAVPQTLDADFIRLQLEKKNSQKALESAKLFHKQCQNGESEELLAKAYQLRIQQLKASGLGKEAVQLIEVAKNKCTHFQNIFEEAEFNAFQFPLTAQDVTRLLSMLQRHKDSQEKTAQLHTILKNGLSDVRHILQCNELVDSHPLRQDAAIVWEAFEATAGEWSEPERGQRLQRLSQVPRQSVLANWCYFIRALDAFHQFDDAKARLFLDRISEESPVSRAAVFLREQLEGKHVPKGLTSKPARMLWNAMTEDSLRTHWLKICHLIKTRQGQGLYNAAQSFFRSQYFSSPVMLRLALQLFVDELNHADYFEKRIFNLVKCEFDRMWGKDGLKFFSLTLCCASEKYDEPFEIAAQFEESIQNWGDLFTKTEQAMILARAAAWYEKEERLDSSFAFPFFMKKKRNEHKNSIRLYREANRLCPKGEYFQKLAQLQRDADYNGKDIESTLLKWKQAFPKDITPLIHLLEDAEERNTLQKALQYLEQAEQIDHLNPKVRNARHRLVWQNIKKHLKQMKWHLVRRDMEKVDLSGMKPDKQSLFRGVEKFLSYLEDDISKMEGEGISLPQILLIHHLNYASGMKIENKLNKIVPLPELSDAAGLEQYYDFRDALISFHDVPVFPAKWFDCFSKWILKAPWMKDELLLRICQTITNHHYPSVVMAATARGLQESGHNLHKYMYYRTFLLVANQVDSEDIQMECYFAALQLSKQQNDVEFVKLCQMHFGKMFHILLDVLGANTEKIKLDERIALRDEELAEILQREKKRKELPKVISRFTRYIPTNKRSKIVDRIISSIPLSPRLFDNVFDDDEFKDDEFDEMEGLEEEFLKEIEKIGNKEQDWQQKLW